MIYKIRKSIIIPFFLSVLALFILWLLSFFPPPVPGERWVTGGLFFISLYFFLETYSREFILKPEGVVIKKFLRKKILKWEQITHLGLLVLNKKAFALLTTTVGFHIISNNLRDFSDILKKLTDRLGKEKVEMEVNGFIANPVVNNGPLRAAWLTFFVTVGVVIFRIFSLTKGSF